MSAIGMPAHLLAYFAPRPPLEKLPIRGHRQYPPYSGLTEFVTEFEKEKPQPLPPFVSPAEKRKEMKELKEKEHAEVQARRRALYDPHLDLDKQKTSDPRRTLFVGRLSYDTIEKKLLKTFEQYGPVRDIRLVTDAEGKPRGYAFIEFRSEEGMWNAYKNANNKVIDGRAVLVDTEKSRTVQGWLPRRLGGGEGPPRRGGKNCINAERRNNAAIARGTRRSTSRVMPSGPRRDRRPPMNRGGVGSMRRHNQYGDRNSVDTRSSHYDSRAASQVSGRSYDRRG